MKQHLKTWLKKIIRRIVEIPEIKQIILDNIAGNTIAGKTSTPSLFGMQYWYEGNLWEPPVQIAIRDLCKPGNVVFDVGANFGGLTTVMSRMVGSRGVVCAFEASPRIIDKCQQNIVLNGCGNTQVYNVAVYHSSNEKVPIYLGGHLNDSIYSNSSADAAAFEVSTLALDDFVDLTGLVPDLVKMDIEGAEFDAIKGMLKTISHAKPHLILETQPQDTKCLDLLIDKGYVAIDLNSYRQVKSPDDYPNGTVIRNNLYIHQDRLSEISYKPPFTMIESGTITKDDFLVASDGSVSLKNPIQLEQGRYLIDVDFVAQGTDNEIMCGVKVENQVVFRYHAYTSLLSQTYRDWVIHLSRASEIQIFFEFINGSQDQTFSVNGASLYRVAEFDNSSASLYI